MFSSLLEHIILCSFEYRGEQLSVLEVLFKAVAYMVYGTRRYGTRVPDSYETKKHKKALLCSGFLKNLSLPGFTIYSSIWNRNSNPGAPRQSRVQSLAIPRSTVEVVVTNLAVCGSPCPLGCSMSLVLISRSICVAQNFVFPIGNEAFRGWPRSENPSFDQGRAVLAPYVKCGFKDRSGDGKGYER
jgi:hypothetical protein